MIGGTLYFSSMNSYFTQRLISGTRAAELMDRLCKEGTPHLFIFSFEADRAFVMPLEDVDPDYIRFSVPGTSSAHSGRPIGNANSGADKEITLVKNPLPFEQYNKMFAGAAYHLRLGDTYLINLTCSTPVTTAVTLEQLYAAVHAPFKLWVKDSFVVFSPERFISINGDCINTYPMKGTIDATLPDAEARILADAKEAAEHATITDLLRNDINMVARNTQVVSYRYTDKIITTTGSLLQISSHIRGTLLPELQSRHGSVLHTLLPAGSVTGAPKQRTVSIIKAIETHTRGFYTGVFGVFNGKDTDSAVMIRFIEQTPAGLVYKSGGGITTQSRAEDEYREMIDKVYVPVS